MTEDLGRGFDARDGIEQEASDSDIIAGAQSTEVLVGQAEVAVTQPAPGDVVTIPAQAGQRYIVEFDPELAQVGVQGNNLILTFPGGGQVVFQNLGTAAQGPDAPVFEIAGTPISSAVIFGQAVALAAGPEIPTFEETAAPPGLQGTGETRYDDDTGDIIDLLDPQGVIPPVELAFRLIDLEPSDIFLEAAPEAALVPPEDFDVRVTANVVDEFPFTFAEGLFDGVGGVNGVNGVNGTSGTGAPELSVTTTADGQTLANSILGPGITVVPGSISYTGGAVASGLFQGGVAAGIGIESGIILTSGNANLALGPNTSDGATGANGLPGDSDLNALIPQNTFDAAVLEFDFVSQGGDLFFNFVFASEEYNEYTNSSYNDVFAFFLDGANIALIPGTNTPISINNVNGGNPFGTNASNSEFFNNNDLSDGGPFFNIEYDGFTDVFTISVIGLAPGTHHIKMAIADAGDSILDSAIFIQAGSFSDQPVVEFGPGFLYEFQVGEAEIVADNIHGTDLEDGVTTQFTITSLPTDQDGNPVGFLFIDRADDNVIDEIVGPGFSGVPINVQTGDSVWYFLPFGSFEVKPELVTFNYFTTDSDGLVSDGAVVTIDFPDAQPVIVSADPTTVDEDDIPLIQNGQDDGPSIESLALIGPDDHQFPGTDFVDGPPVDPTTVTGTIAVNFEFDRPGTLTFNQAAIDALNALGLTSSTVKSPAFPDGVPLSYEIVDAGRTLIATAGDGGPEVLRIELSPAVSAGLFSYDATLTGSINHPLTDDPGTPGVETAFEDPLTLQIPFTATDFDGDSATSTLSVTLTDDIPEIEIDGAEGGSDLKVSESDIATQAAFDSVELSVVFGADGPEPDLSQEEPPFEFVLTRILALAEGPGDPASDPEIPYWVDGVPQATVLMSGGHEVEIRQVGPLTWEGFIPGEIPESPEGGENGISQVSDETIVFRATVDNFSGILGGLKATVHFELFEKLDHPDADEVMSDDNIRFEFTVTATDDDGDAVTQTITVDVDDDGPIALDDVNATTAGGTLNVAAVDGVLENDLFGADGAATGGGVTGVVAGAGAPLGANVGNPIAGSLGTLTLNADGSYTYVANPGPGGTDVFTYQAEDGDGDTEPATLTITVTSGEDNEPNANPVTLTHDETPGDDGDDDIDPTTKSLNLSNALVAVFGVASAALLPDEIGVAAKEFGFSYGGDGKGATGGIALDPVAVDTDSTLIDVTSGAAILINDGPDGTVVGTVAGTGEIAFVAFLEQVGGETGPQNDATGALSFVQYRAVAHDNPNDPDEANPEPIGFLDESVALGYTVTDANGTTDGDTATVTVEDDGPSIGDIAMINDETAGVDPLSDDIDFDLDGTATPGDPTDDVPSEITDIIADEPINASKKLVDFKYGADGPGGIALDPIDQVQFPDGQPSDLFDTATGDPILLFNGPAGSGTIVGKVGSVEGPIAFVSVLNETGTPNGAPNGNESTADLWFAQYRAIQHDNPLDPDEAGPEGGGGGTPGSETITFEGLAAGTIVTQVFGDGGSGPIVVKGFNPDLGAGVNAAMIFDSNNPTGTSGPLGIDFDLGTPNEVFDGPGVGTGGESGPFANNTSLNNILIVSENLDQNNPNDEGTPGTILSFDFSALGSVTVETITVIDIEAKEKPPRVELFDDTGFNIATFLLPIVGDNGVGTFSLGDVDGVRTMNVILNGSGAIDNIGFRTAVFGDEVLTLGYTVTDADGDTVPGTATIAIEDDGPTANSDAAVYLDAGDPPVGGDVTANDLFGADGDTFSPDGPLHTFTFIGNDGFDNAIELTATEGTTVTTFAGGELTVNGDGIWTYDAPTSVSEAALIELGLDADSAGFVDDFGYDIHDGDGDVAHAVQPIRVVLDPEAAQFGTAAGETLTGDLVSSDFLSGGDGGDTLNGNGGGDLLFGDAGDDILNGDAGNDLLFGDGGEDQLDGGLGDDTLTGGSGHDTLTGGDGADLFVLRPGDGGATLAEADLITDYEDGVDHIGLAGGLTPGNLTVGSDGANAVISSSVSGEILAIVMGIDPLDITTDDFINVV